MTCDQTNSNQFATAAYVACMQGNATQQQQASAAAQIALLHSLKAKLRDALQAMEDWACEIDDEDSRVPILVRENARKAIMDAL